MKVTAVGSGNTTARPAVDCMEETPYRMTLDNMECTF